MELQKRRIQAGCHPLRSALNGLPNTVGAICDSPAMRTSMHGILPCSITHKNLQKVEQLYQIRPSAMQADATIFLVVQFNFFTTCKSSASFNFFNFFNFPTAGGHSSPSFHQTLNWTSLVACLAPSKQLIPLFIRDFYHCYCIHRCCQILTSREEILAILEHRTDTYSVNTVTHQRGLCRILLVNGIQDWNTIE